MSLKRYSVIGTSLKLFGLSLGVQIVVGIILSFMVQLLHLKPLDAAITGIVANIGTIWLVYRWYNKPFHLERLYQQSIPIQLFLVLAIAVLLLQLMSGQLNQLDYYVPAWPFLTQLFNGLVGSLLGTVVISLIGPLFEELMMRGIILQIAAAKYAPWVAITLSAFLFAIYHLNPWQFPFAFLMGLLLGWVFLKTRSLLVTTGLHIVANSFGVLTALIHIDSVLFPDRGYHWQNFFIGGLAGIALFFTLRWADSILEGHSLRVRLKGATHA